MAQHTDIAGQLTAAEAAWHQASINTSMHASSQVDAARNYLLAIDAYIADLRSHGRPIPHRLDEVAAALRASYGDRERGSRSIDPV